MTPLPLPHYTDLIRFYGFSSENDSKSFKRTYLGGDDILKPIKDLTIFSNKTRKRIKRKLHTSCFTSFQG